MKNIILTLTYKTGYILQHSVRYVHFENGYLYFVVKKNPQMCIVLPSRISLENLESFTVENN